MTDYLERHKNYLKYLLLVSLTSLVILFVPRAAHGAWYNLNWQYRKQITIKGSEVTGGPHASFPVLIQMASDADLAADAQDDGDDILFTSSDETTKIPHEIESFNGSTGALLAWVKVDLNANPTNTIIYMYYGYSSASNQQNAANVWSDYKGVWHLNEVVSDEAATATHYDSTSNNNDGAQHNNNDATGKIGRGQDFDGDNDYISVPSNASLQPTTVVTLSGWIKLRSFGTADEVDPIIRKGDDNNNNYELIVDDSKAQLVLDGGDGDTILGSTTLSANTWYYIVGTWQSGGQRRVYLNGAQNGSTGSFAGPIGTDTRPFYMGGRSGSDYSDSTLDEVRISKTYHAAQWIQTEYNNQNNPTNFITVGAATPSGGSNNPPIVDAGSDQDVTLPAFANLDGMANDGGDGPTNPPNVTWTKQSGPGSVTFGDLHAQDTTASFSTNGTYVLRLTADDGVDTAYDEVTITVYPAGGPPPIGDYSCNMKITIDHTKVSGTSDLSYFPVVISLTDDTLKNTGCGFITSSDGDDIIFTNESKTLQLDHEIEKYDGSVGELVVWVKIPSLSVSTDTAIYVYYGNSNVTTPQENPVGVWDSNYKNVWHLKEDPSTTAPQMEDSTSSGNHGTSRGTMTSGDQVAGKIGGSLDFDGSNDYVYTTNSSNNPQNFTVSAWFKTGSASGKRVVGFESTQTGTGSGHWDRHIYVGTDGKVYFGAYSEANGSTDVAVSTNTLNDNNWHYAVGIRDDAANRVRLYIDGNFNDSTYNSAAENFSGWWRIGSYKTSGWPNGQDGYFPGVIDEVRVSTTVRSADWIKTEYNNQVNPSAFYSVEKNCPSTTPPISEFSCSVPITIDSSRVSGTGNLIDFPVLISVTDTGLKTAANCGHVQNSSGYDIIFSDSTQTIQLDHEIEKYDGTAGQLVAWVRIPSLSATSDTTIYIHFGNSNVCGSTENPTGVWDDDYVGVWHLKESSGSGSYLENSKQNSYYGDPDYGSTFLADAKIAGGRVANSRIYIDNGGDIFDGDTAFTLSFWGYPNYSSDAEWEAAGEEAMFMTNSIWGLRWTHFSGNAPGTGWIQADVRFTSGTNYFNDWSNVLRAQWNHLVLNYDGSALRWYINGNMVQQSTGYTGQALISNSECYFVDGSPDYIDEVRYSRSARSADWIKTEYNNQSDPSSFYSVGASSCFLLSGFSCNRKITIDSSKVESTSDLINFPVLIKIDKDCNIKTAANGGSVQNSNGWDIVFTDSDGVTQLDHEIEEYDGDSGDLTAWVKIPTLPHDTDKDIYMYYGKSGLACNPSNPTGVWASNYRGVWHLHDTSGDTQDSTSYNRDGTLSGTITRGANGEIDNAFDVGYQGEVDWGDPGDGHLDFGTGSMTLSLWVNMDNHRGAWEQIIMKGKDSYDPGYQIEVDSGSNIFYFTINEDDGDYEWGRTASIPFDLDTWTYVVGIVDRANNRIRGYKDGVQVDSSDISLIGSISTWDSLTIGRDDWGYPDARIEEVRLANTARSAGWIKTEYNNQSDPSSFYSMSQDTCGGSYGFNYQYCKKITVDHTQVAQSSNQNFPLLINLQNYDELKTEANGGRVGNDHGWDIVFKDKNCLTLDHEIDYYDGTTGTLVAWVRIPDLTNTEDYEVYMYYGDSNVICSPENPEGLWDPSIYEAVYHLSGDYKDSTSNDRDGTNYGTTFTVSQIGKGALFTPSNGWDHIELGTWSVSDNDLAIQAWVWPNDFNQDDPRIVSKCRSTASGSQDHVFMLSLNDGDNGENRMRFRIKTGTDDATGTVMLYGNSPNGYLPSAQQWYLLTGTYIDSSDQMQVWRGSTGDATVWQSGWLRQNSWPVWIGANPYGSSNSSYSWDGILDEVRIISQPRSAGWITTEYRNQNDPGNFYTVGSCFEQTTEETQEWEEEVQ